MIELLVVISIIALLIGILLPVLGSAREASRQAGCLSNTRQIAIAWTNYAYDNRKALMMPSEATYDGPKYVTWFGGFIPDDGTWMTGDFNPADGYIGPYLGDNGDVGGCYSFQHDTGDGSSPWIGQCDYAYNTQMTVKPGVLPQQAEQQSIDRLKTPSETSVFWDGARVFADDPDVLWRTMWGYPSSYQYPTFHGRHVGDSGNVAWADGHASTQPVKYLRSSYDNSGHGFASAVAASEKWKVGDLDKDDDPDTDEWQDFK